MDFGPPIDPFEYESVAGRIAFGRGAVANLRSMLAEHDAERALVICGSNVGANASTMSPIAESLGDALAGTFDGTTAAKHAREAFDGLDTVREIEADALVAVGGGSSLDVARAMCALYDEESDDDYDDVRARVVEAGALPVGDASLPVLAVPTTLAGADLSTVGSVTFYGSNSDASSNGGDGGETVTAGYGDPALMPDGLVYDPDLFETVPVGVLAGSAMNGFDKGIELPYSRHANPLTDAPALRGLSLLAPALPRLDEAAAGEEPAVMDRIVAGIVCVQHGRATRRNGLLSVIHAFGHGLRAEGVQQGVAHAVMAPPVLDYLFDRVDGRREVLAAALDAGAVSGDDPATGVVSAVEEVRDGLNLPARLRDVDELERENLSGVAGVVVNDSFLANGPQGLDPTREEIDEVLNAAW